MHSNNGKKTTRTAKAKARLFAIVVAASLGGIQTATVMSAILLYDSFFERYERPDYAQYPGLYCYERIQETLKRQTLRIPSGACHLQGYYYPAKDSRGLAVLAHGFHAGADDYLPLIEALVTRGYSVLTYDVRGVYSSGGDGMVGMCQSLRDMDNVLKFAESKKPFADMPKVVIGHSWGGYAAASVLALHSEVRAAALLAPMNCGTTVMLETAEQYAGKSVYTVKPVLDAYQKVLFGDYITYDGVKGINSTDAPVLIAQGLEDTVIPHDGSSVTAHLDEIFNPNLTVYWGEGAQATHTGIWHSAESEQYAQKVSAKLGSMEQMLGRKLTDEELTRFYEKVDHRRYSEVNAELMDLIVATFDKGIGN